MVFMEAHAAFEWGVPLDRWFELPETVRGMMIAYLDLRTAIEELMAEENERAWASGHSNYWRQR